MYCSNCGKPLDSSARFCPSCGVPVQPVMAGAPVFSRLVRLRNPRVFGGVCSGLALHYGWDVVTVRLIWVLCALFALTGVLAYVIAWIVIPEAPYALPEHSTGSGA